MAQRSRPTSNKWRREQSRVAKQKAKEARRVEKSKQDRESTDTPAADTSGDPDIAHIRPGPQPPADWQTDGDE
jgi:hypothetical protein